MDSEQKINEWQRFADFCRYEKLTGGPDPHLSCTVKMCEGHSSLEKLWRAALYVGFYNVPSAEVVWTAFPNTSYRHNRKQVEQWLDKNWRSLCTRKERRTVKSPARMAKYLDGYEHAAHHLAKVKSFEEAWSLATGLPHVGRYAATKLTEIWYRLGWIDHEISDIRAKGAWSPRAALKLLYPEETHDEYDNSKSSIEHAEEMAADARVKLRKQYGISLSWFETEVLLCESRESRQYPGRSLDSELKYEYEVRGPDEPLLSEHMRVRKELFPNWALGELNHWVGPREEVTRSALYKYGYVWSDSVYDYGKTSNFSNPVRKNVDKVA